MVFWGLTSSLQYSLSPSAALVIVLCNSSMYGHMTLSAQFYWVIRFLQDAMDQILQLFFGGNKSALPVYEFLCQSKKGALIVLRSN